MTQLKCTACGMELNLTDKEAGMNGKCPQCGAAAEIPDVSAPDPKTLKKTAQTCITMFVVFVGAIVGAGLLILGDLILTPFQRYPGVDYIFSSIGLVYLLSLLILSIYAFIFITLEAAIVSTLPTVPKVLGFIGCIGLSILLIAGTVFFVAITS
jgi:hypothetical protein